MAGTVDVNPCYIKNAKAKITATKTMANQWKMPQEVRKNAFECEEDSDEVELPPWNLGDEVEIPPRIKSGDDRIPPQDRNDQVSPTSWSKLRKWDKK